MLLTGRLTGPCFKEAPAKVEHRLVVNKEEKYLPHIQIPLLERKQMLKKRAQGRPFFAPYPKILDFLEGIMASRKEKNENMEDTEGMNKREKEVKNFEPTKISYESIMCGKYPPACNKLYMYHL